LAVQACKSNFFIEKTNKVLLQVIVKTKPKVLMFGWEFPPVINGGLGVACLGLCKAMAPMVKLKMVIPKTSPDYAVNYMELIGLNAIDVSKLKSEGKKKHYKRFSKPNYFNISLTPYLSFPGEEEINRVQYEVHNSDLQHFEIDELYGGDVIRKVLEFSKISVKLAATKEFDIIHAHDWMTFLPGMEIKAATGKPLVLHVHSLEYDRSGPENKSWVYQLEKRAMEYADAIIPVSRYTGTIIKNHYGISPDKIFPVHNGIEAVNHSKLKRITSEKIVIFLGRLTMQKGPEYYFEAAKKVLNHYPNVRFVLAGTGELMKGIMERAAEARIGHRFHTTGFLTKDKVNDLLAVADVYCMPSVSEPFGLSVVEAVQYGIPTIMSKQSGASEVIHGSLKMDYWDVDKLASYIISLLEFPTLRKELVDEAYVDLKKISWVTTAKQVLKVYDKLLSEKK